MAEFRLDLTSTVSSWPELAEENLANIAEGWNIAGQVALLHSLALQRIAKHFAPKPSLKDELSLLLGTHGLNLFIEIMGLIVRGRFDVASHLMRAILDCQSLAFAVSQDQQLAEEFHEGKLRAADGRKRIVSSVRAASPELADFLDKRFKDEFDAANELSHVNLTHLDKVIDKEEGSITPIIGGRTDKDLARRMVGAVLEHGFWHLTWFRASFEATLGSDWLKDYDDLRQPFYTWMKEVFSGTGSSPAHSE